MKRWLPPMGALAGASIAACVSIPDFQQRDAGNGSGDATVDGSGSDVMATVTWVDDGAGGTAIGPWFSVHFGSGSVFHYPDEIAINSTSIIGRNSGVACNNEDEVGTALYPSGRVAVHGPAAIASSLLVKSLSGPAVVKVEVSSVATMNGSDGVGSPLAREVTIRSRFTFHPDGKMFRYDTIAGTGTPITTASVNCQGGASGFIPTSFTTLRLDQASQLYRGPNSVNLALPMAGDVAYSDNSQTSACLDYGTSQVAFAWYDTTTRIRAPTSSTISFVYDFDRAAGSATSIGDLDYWTRSLTILGRGSSCTAANGVHDHARHWRDTHNLFFNGVPREISNDGIYGGESDPGNQIGIDIPPTGVTLTGEVPSSFAVWLIYAPGTNAMTIEKADAMGPFYQVQKVDGQGKEWVIWFRDPLQAGQAITVKPT